MKHKLPIFVFCLLIVIANRTFPSDKWHIEDGWAFKNGEKFFAIGVWGFPQYEFKLLKRDTEVSNIRVYKELEQIFNLIYIQYGREQDYMQDGLLFTGFGHFIWKMKKGFSGLEFFLPDKNQNKKIELQEMQFIKDNLQKYYSRYIYENIVLDISNRFKSHNFIWFLMDEPNTGFGDWVWYPEIVKSYDDAVKKASDSTLTYVDLFGTIRGDRYSYEHNYRKMYGKRMEELSVGKNQKLLQGDTLILNSYIYSADGMPVYRFNTLRNQWEYTDLQQFTDKFYYNIFFTASIYGLCADILGVNCYYDYYHYPYAAGLTVDAIKDACGSEKPVWLFFDGAAHAKPRNISNKEYIENVRCQIYSSIIQGASGVLIWSKKEVSTQYWNLILRLCKELQQNSEIIKGIEIERGQIQNIIYSIRETKDGKRYFIAANTDTENSAEFKLANKDLLMNPLQVIIERY
jgi:hypothetical protein